MSDLMSDYRGPKSYSTETFAMMGQIESIKENARREIFGLLSKIKFLEDELELLGNWVEAHAKEMLEHKSPAEVAVELLEFYHHETSPPKPDGEDLARSMIDILRDDDIFGMSKDEVRKLVEEIVDTEM